ncbi:MAG: PQQ-binding-like beta-propeller repeat protein, partial [Desulfobacterales bacterium]|nr:PQQ-binding-like beta-propeller repeat protein [Desulfobacterales bacterium]
PATVEVSQAASEAPGLIWKKRGALHLKTRPALGDDGFLYAAAGPGAEPDGSGLAKFDPSDGSVVWGPVIPSRCVNGGKYIAGRVSAGANRTIYTMGDWNECGDGWLTAVDPENGAFLWERGTDGGYSPHPRQTPAVDDDLGAVYFGTNALFSVNMASGETRWLKTGGLKFGNRGIAIDSEHNIYYVSCLRTNHHILRSFTSDGALRWQKSALDESYYVRAILPGDVLLLTNVKSSGGWLRALDKNGNDLWQFPNVTDPVIDGDGAVYACGGVEPEVISLDADGAEVWRRTLPSEGRVYLDFVDDAGRLYVRAGYRLFALNGSDGGVLWSFSAEDDLKIGAVLTPGGRIFLADENGSFYLLDTTLAYADSAWPIANFGNRRHTEKTGDRLPLPGAVFLSSTTYTVNEGDGAAAITATLPYPESKTIRVDYAAADGTATAGEDYTATSGTLTFAPGETEKTFTVPLLDDGIAEPDETIMISLSNPAEVFLGAPAAAVLTIVQTNAPPTASEDAYSVTEGRSITAAAPGVLVNDSDPEKDALTAILVTDASHGDLSLNPDGSFVYQHDGGETAGDAFTYKAGDGANESAPAEVRLTILGVDDPPEARGDAYSVDEGGVIVEPPPGVLGNDSDPENDALTAVLVTDV